MTTTLKAQANVDLTLSGDPKDIKDVKERAKSLLADLHKAVESVVTSDSFLRYIELISHSGMKRYSFNNRALVILQLMRRYHCETVEELFEKTPIFVMGFKQWKERFNRTAVKGGATFITAPCVGKREVKNEDGSKEKQSFVYGFRTVPVFNISETEGDDVEIFKHHDVQDAKADGDLLAFLVSEIEKRGYSYSEDEIGGTTKGYTSPTKKVVVDSRMNPTEKIATAAHELGHIVLGHIERIDEYNHHRGEMETEADTVSYLLLREFGIETEAFETAKADYIAGWSGGNMKLVARTADNAIKAFEEIVGAQEDKIVQA